ncbi:hypothetical protein F2Q69_00003562 [Brassica cretica]|uniref:Uncharacterized protein n=1 Tax=Brassica cretica TaxID=69181 RepID=A0A8S9P5A8_BRACR|nr:hypothetical protein F2Q69_00003562 [Brassica cretica]
MQGGGVDYKKTGRSSSIVEVCSASGRPKTSVQEETRKRLKSIPSLVKTRGAVT